jgi:hypothetical protein
MEPDVADYSWIFRILGAMSLFVGLPLAVYNILYLTFTPNRGVLYFNTEGPVGWATAGIVLALLGWNLIRHR